MSLFLFCWFQKSFLHSPTWQTLGMPPGVPPHLQHVIRAMYIVVYAKVWINGDTHDEVMSNIGVKQGCPLSPPHTQFGLYIDELETYLDEIDGDSPCLLNAVVAILLHVDDIVLLSRLGASLQRLLNKPYEFCTSCLEVNLYKTKIMIFGRNKRNLNQEAFLSIQGFNWDYPWITNTLGLICIHMATLSHLVKGKELQV